MERQLASIVSAWLVVSKRLSATLLIKLPKSQPDKPWRRLTASALL
jgi:hypothetical protein